MSIFHTRKIPLGPPDAPELRRLKLITLGGSYGETKAVYDLSCLFDCLSRGVGGDAAHGQNANDGRESGKGGRNSETIRPSNSGTKVSEKASLVAALLKGGSL
jgi:hypothetical protein